MFTQQLIIKAFECEAGRLEHALWYFRMQSPWFLVKMPPSSLFVRSICALCRFINGQFDSVSAEVMYDYWGIASGRQRSLAIAMVIAREEPETEFCFVALLGFLGLWVSNLPHRLFSTSSPEF